jgi:hypothetical protein
MWERLSVTRCVDYFADGSAVGLCVVLPGRTYTPDGPLLFFAAQTALMRGWDVRQVWWDVPDLDDAEEVAWVGDQLDAAIDGHDGPVLVVAKSLGTLAASRAALRGYDAAWLTPLLTEPDLAAPLMSYPARQLVVVGSDDPYFDEEVFGSLPGERLAVPGDHILRVPGDASGMVASHDRFVRSFDSWLATA